MPNVGRALALPSPSASGSRYPGYPGRHPSAPGGPQRGWLRAVRCLWRADRQTAAKPQHAVPGAGLPRTLQTPEEAGGTASRQRDGASHGPRRASLQAAAAHSRPAPRPTHWKKGSSSKTLESPPNMALLLTVRRRQPQPRSRCFRWRLPTRWFLGASFPSSAPPPFPPRIPRFWILIGLGGDPTRRRETERRVAAMGTEARGRPSAGAGLQPLDPGGRLLGRLANAVGL